MLVGRHVLNGRIIRIYLAYVVIKLLFKDRVKNSFDAVYYLNDDLVILLYGDYSEVK